MEKNRLLPEDREQVDPMIRALSFMERVFGFHHFRPGQGEILQSILEGSETLVIMPTGGGKSLCYQVPAFIRQGITLVISPLIALMKDQVDTLRVLDLPITAIHSLMSLKEQEQTLHQIRKGEIKLVYASPERLRNQSFVQALKESDVSMVAVDEAHCISQWGHDFRPDYLKISQALTMLGRPQTIALTATATEKVRADIVAQLKLRAPRVFITGFDRRNLFWEVAPVWDDMEKTALMRERLRDLAGAAIVYAGTRKNVSRIVTDLQETGFNAEAYHAGMDKDERTRVQENFMEGRTNLVVATNAFGMGIDRSDIRLVIHHNFPGTIEAYYQEGGRAGRDGDPATCLLLYSPKDRRLQEFFIETRYPPREKIYRIYDYLRQRPENILWLTYREIGTMNDDNIPALTVASCIKILEDAGAVQRLQRYDNQAELYLHQNPRAIINALSSKSKNGKKLLEGLERLYGEQQLGNGIHFYPAELADLTDLSLNALRRAILKLESEGHMTYIPPFRGRGLRILKRVAPEKLGIDFQSLQVHKANEIAKLDQVVAYATTTACRRMSLLRYFGETHTGQTCGACDICRADTRFHPAEETADPILAVKVLSGVARLKGRYGPDLAVKVLTGSQDPIIFQNGLQRLSTYALLADNRPEQVQHWIEELLAGGCIVSHPPAAERKDDLVLELTEHGKLVMAGKKKIFLTSPILKEGPPAMKAPTTPQTEKEIFEKLRELRTRLARRERLPSYCIFQDRTLRDMARRLPSTPEELLSVVGIGEITLKKYGKPLLSLLNTIINGH